VRPLEEEIEAGRPPDNGGAEPRAHGDEAADARAGSGPFAEPWLLAACLCLLAAAVCLWLALFDAAFVAAALGAVAWFLNVRSKLPPRGREEASEEDGDDEQLEEDEE
jgi:hypothetical protein